MRKTHAAFLFLQGCEFAFGRSGKKDPDKIGKSSRRIRKILPTIFFDRFRRCGVGAKRKQGAALQMAMRLLDVMCENQKGIRWTECPIR